MNKPLKTLTQLEEEPASGFFGVPYSEIVAALQRSMLSVAVAIPLISTMIRWEAAAILAIFFGCIVFTFYIRKYSGNRADKPLFYHKHKSTFKSRLFIQPVYYYQRERREINHVSKKQSERK